MENLQTGRAKGIQKIIFLHEKKGYKIDTLFKACTIFDRYMSIAGHWNFPINRIMALACISLLLTVKCEEDFSPSFGNMIQLLSVAERQGLSVDLLESLERDILLQFGYELNYPGPIDSLDRFMRLTGLHNNQEVR